MAADPDASPGEHYFTSRPDAPSEPMTVHLALPDLRADLATDRSVFSPRQVDPGTRILLVDGPPIAAPTGRLLDLGCGYAPIAYALARRAPASEVWAADVNERALGLAEQNLAACPNAQVRHVDDVPDDLTFDEIWSNPPIRIGKVALRRLLVTWLARLAPRGRAVLVVQRHLGADSLAEWLRTEGWDVTRLRSRMGYRILEVTST